MQSTTWHSPEGQPGALSIATLKPLHLCLAERGTISSVELDGSHFRLVREGLHGLSLFAIGEGFLLWSTTSTNGRSVCCAFPTSSYCTSTLGFCQSPRGAGLALCGVKGKLGDPPPPISGTLEGRRWSSADPICLQAPARSGTAGWSRLRTGGSRWSRSW